MTSAVLPRMVEDDSPSEEGENVGGTRLSSANREQAIRRAIARRHSDTSDNVSAILKSNAVASACATRPEQTPKFIYPLSAVDGKEEAVLRSIKSEVARERLLRKSATFQLRRVYKELNTRWQQHCSFLGRADFSKDSELAKCHPLYGYGEITKSAGDSNDPSTASHNSSHDQDLVLPYGPAGAQNLHPQVEETLHITGIGRSNRRNTQSGALSSFGDAVRSEAEFLEILASLENADMQDPNMRAARTTAVVPDMVMRVSAISGNVRNGATNPYHDDGGFVADPLDFYLSDFDPDYWSDEDIAVFEKRYALYPKQFGKIASGLESKSTTQCVAYYYATKKLVDYKSMLTVKNRDRRRKTKMVKPKKGRGSALMADLKAVASVDELQADEDESTLQYNDTDLSSVSNVKRGSKKTAREKQVLQEGAEQITPAVDESADFTLSEVVGENEHDRQDSAKLSRALSKPTTSSYWSIAERIGFLKSLATFGRDWDALANHLVTKSAAQARNFFVRNAEDADFVEAVQLARGNQHLSLEERFASAELFVQRRNSHRQPTEVDLASRHQNERLNISNLLNAEVQEKSDIRSGFLTDWFGTDESGHASSSRTSNADHLQLGHYDLMSRRDDIPDRPYDDESPHTASRLTETASYNRPASASGYPLDRGDYGASYERREYYRDWNIEAYRGDHVSSSRTPYQPLRYDDRRQYPPAHLTGRNHLLPHGSRHGRDASAHRDSGRD